MTNLLSAQHQPLTEAGARAGRLQELEKFTAKNFLGKLCQGQDRKPSREWPVRSRTALAGGIGTMPKGATHLPHRH